MDSAAYRTCLKWNFPALALVLLYLTVLGACTSHPAPATKPASSSAFRVALLTPGPVSDAGWNAAAYEGLELIKAKLGADTALVQTKSPADFDDAFRDFASRIRPYLRSRFRVHRFRHRGSAEFSEYLLCGQFGK